MRIPRRIALLTLLTLALVGLGFWARHQAMVKDLQSIFATTVFSPIRAEYPSVVTSEELATIERREQELQRRSKMAALTWKCVAIALFAGALGSLAPVVILGRRTLKNRRETLLNNAA